MVVRAVTRPRPFAASLRGLGALRDPALLLDPSGTILFVNEAWEGLARAAGGGSACLGAALVGTRWLDHVHGDAPRQRHAALLERAARPGAEAVVQLNEANDAGTARLVATRLEPVVAGPGLVAGVTVVHRIVRERPIAEVYPPVPLDGTRWRAADGAVVQCSCCRRTRRPESADEWDLVPELLVVPPPETRYDYCALCLELHVGGT